MDHFIKWFEAMPTISNDGATAKLFIYIISRFWVPKTIMSSHGSHFMMQMDIGGHPPIPLAHIIVFYFGIFSIVFMA